MTDPFPARVAEGISAEFPGLQVLARCGPGPVRTQAGLGERLDAIAGRIRGATAIEMRREPVAAAYRAFYRQLGVDPDSELPPGEQAVGRRLFDGGVRARGPLADALELAVLETGVPVYALDREAIDGGFLEIRGSLGSELVEAADGAARADPGRLVIADRTGPLCWLFEQPYGRGAAGDASRSLVLAAVGAPGVPDICLDEALDVAEGSIAG